MSFSQLVIRGNWVDVNMLNFVTPLLQIFVAGQLCVEMR